ncbi:MAG: YicC/YloC family endoribonuclease [Synergistaceae bacterium]
MYISMTGFSRAQVQQTWGTLSLELSSVNHRYQEIFVKLPREFSSWEPWFHQRLRKYFRRGKVQLRMEILWAPSFRTGRINREIFSSYLEEFSVIQKELGQNHELDIERIVSLPGVLDMPKFECSEEAESLESVFDALLLDGVTSWQDMRKTEGMHLKDEVLEHLSELERLATVIEDKWLPAKNLAFKALKDRLNETLDSLGGKLDDDRFMQEVVILTDKWDVSEELGRLKSHVMKFKKTGEESESSGRKLDFIVQEMNREVNTLDSKVADAEIRWLAVDAKAALERIREQIQNLE